MSLFQPSNITPSTFAGIGSGVVSRSDPLKISWQVNGPSPLTAFKIDIYENIPTANTPVFTQTVTLLEPFYGTDINGNPVFYEYAPPNMSFYDLNITDGKSYKMYITQSWGSLSNASETVVQYSPSVFEVKSSPQLYIAPLQLQDGYLASINYTFTASFYQEQGDTINWVRWSLAIVAENGMRTVIDDTGVVYTSVLSYSYNGLSSGTTYSVKCEVQTSSGVVADTDWQDFQVLYSTNAINASIAAECGNDSSMIIDLQSVSASEGVVSPTESGAFLKNDQLIVKQGSNISWDDSNEGAFKFSPPYSVSWQGDLTGLIETATDKSMDAFWSLDKYNANNLTSFVYCLSRNQNNCYINCYKVESGSSVIKLYSMPIGVVSSSAGIAISSSQSMLVLFDEEESVKIYSIDPSTGELTSSGVLPDVPSGFRTTTAKFNQSGEYFVLGGLTNTYLYSCNSSFVYIGELYDGDGNAISAWSIDTYDWGTDFWIAIGFFGSRSHAGAVISCDGSATNFLYWLNPVPSNVYGMYSVVAFNGTGTVAYVSGFYISPDETKELANIYNVSESSATFVSSFSLPSSGTTKYAQLKVAVAGDYTFLGAIGDTFYSIKNFPQAGDNNALEKLFEVSFYKETNGIVSDALFCLLGSPDFLYVLGGDTLSFHSKTYDPQSAISTSSISIDIGRDSISVNGIQTTIKSTKAIITVTESNANIQYDNGYTTTLALSSYTQSDITNVTLEGYTRTDFIVINSGSVVPEYNNPSQTFETYFYYNAKNGGTTASATNSVRKNRFLYRIENGNLKNLLSFQSSANKLRDFNVKSNTPFSYQAVSVMKDGSVAISAFSEPYNIQLRSYYLIEATRDQNDPCVYHALNVWRFGNNISAGSVSNNNAPNWLTNFTPYRLKQPASRMGRTGTLQALLSNVKNGEYKDTVYEQEKLFQASQSTNAFFLKDMKGNMYMVSISAPITQKINTASTDQRVTISVPWEEIGSMENVSVIQLSTDAGWKENMVGDVMLDTNVETGSLIATYPDNYFGTTFKLQNSDLLALTEQGVPDENISLSLGSVIVTSVE